MSIGRLRQAHTALACSFGFLMMGIVNTWPSYTAEYYHSNTTSPLSAPITGGEEALLGSLPSLGAMFGSGITGMIMDKLGRRNAAVVLSMPVLLSWAIVSIASSVTLILAARFMAGVSGGAMFVLGPMFISEVAEDSIRGTLTSTPVLLYCFGTIVSYLIGWCLTYRPIIWIYLALSTFGVAILVIVTESPTYLMRQKREVDAQVAIAKYRGVPVSSKLVLDEISKLKQQIMPSVELVSVTDTDLKADEAEKEKLNLEPIEQEEQKSTSAIKLLLMQPSRRAFFVVMVAITMQCFMGMVPMQVYVKTVFTQTDASMADIYTILFAVVLFIGSGVSTVITDKAGRRILVITSSVLVFITMLSLGYLLQTKSAPPIFTVIFVYAYCFAFMLGAGTIPFVQMAEFFIPEVQSLASMIIIEYLWFLNFMNVGIFPYMNIAFGIHGCFYIFAAVGLANAVIAYFIVPETKGLSNMQIQDIFLSKRIN